MQHVGPFFVDWGADAVSVASADGEDAILTPREAQRIAKVLESTGTLSIRNMRVCAGIDAKIQIGTHSHHVQRVVAEQLARVLRADVGSPF